MKHLLTLTAAALLLAACNNSEDEYHQLYFYPQTVGGMELFADQTTDSITFVSTDDWTAHVTGDWFSINPTELKIPTNYLMLSQQIHILTTPNTTGNIRQGSLQVDSYDKLGMPIKQFPWLNIQYPVPTFKSEAEIPTDLERIEFKLTVPATMEYIPLIFTTYAEQATLTTDAEWLTLPDTIFSPGTHSFQPAIPANKTKDMRTATLKLRSGELENEIHITQSAAEQ